MNLENIKLVNLATIETEEATKMSLILPFIQELGYNVFDINEVIPEYTADIGKRKGEKVDYAIKFNDKINFIVEAKSVNENLTKHPKQLARYFANTDTKIGILTNGIIYQFYTDVEKDNIMDNEPFYVFNIKNYNEKDIEQLKEFTKEHFDESKLYGKAEKLRIIDTIADYLRKEFKNPSDDFVRLILNSTYDGVKTQNVIQEYQEYVKSSYTQLMDKELISKMNIIFPDKDISVQDLSSVDNEVEEKRVVETTERELTVYNYVQVILEKHVDLDRISWKDNSTYFNILLDGKVTKWILRVFDRKQLKIGIFNGERDDVYDLDNEFEIFKYEKEIVEAFNKRQ